MLRLAIHYIAFASNLLVILAIPQSIAPKFLTEYAAASVVAGCLTVLFFSSSLATRSSVRAVISIAISISLLSISIVNAGSGAILATALIFSDYAVSQIGKKQVSMAYRLTIIASSVAFVPVVLAESREWFYIAVWSRILLSYAWLAYVFTIKGKWHKLDMRSPVYDVLHTHAAHYGALLIIAQYVPPNMMKPWYLIAQVILSLILKAYDFSIRASEHLPRHSLTILSIVLSTIIIATAYLWWSPVALITVLVSSLSLSTLFFKKSK